MSSSSCGISWKGICCFLSPFLDQDWPVALVHSISQASILAGYPSSAVPHHCFMLETQRSSFLCLKCTAVFGRLRRISFLKKQDLALIRFILLFFSPPPENLQRSLSLLRRLSNPCCLHAARLTAVCVMASRSSWHALCSLAIGNALNTDFSLTFFFALSLGSKCIWFLFYSTFFMSIAPLLIWKSKIFFKNE